MQRVTRVSPYDNVANCTQWRACSRSLCSSRKNNSARSWGEEKAFIDRLSSLGSVLLFPSPIPLKAELITDGRAYARKMERPWSRWFFCSRQSFRPSHSAQMTRHSSMILMRLPSVITHARHACKWNVNSGYLMPQDGDRGEDRRASITIRLQSSRHGWSMTQVSHWKHYRSCDDCELSFIRRLFRRYVARETRSVVSLYENDIDMTVVMIAI